MSTFYVFFDKIRFMKTDSQKKYHHGNLKESLIQTALEMVSDEGADSITLREIGSRLGTSRSAIYRHFKNKEELMKHVILAGFDKLDETIEPIFLDETTSFLEKFHAMGLGYMHFALENQHLYRLIFGPTMIKEREEVLADEKEDLYKLLHGDSSKEIMNVCQDNGYFKLVTMIILAQEKKIFKAGNPVNIATAIWAQLHGIASLAIDGHLSVMENIDEIFEMNYKILLEGLSA